MIKFQLFLFKTFKNLLDGWINFFIISIVIYLIGCLSFILFATDIVLSWAKINTNDQNSNYNTTANGEINPSFDEVTRF